MAYFKVILQLIQALEQKSGQEKESIISVRTDESVPRDAKTVTRDRFVCPYLTVLSDFYINVAFRNRQHGKTNILNRYLQCTCLLVSFWYYPFVASVSCQYHSNPLCLAQPTREPMREPTTYRTEADALTTELSGPVTLFSNVFFSKTDWPIKAKI